MKNSLLFAALLCAFTASSQVSLQDSSVVTNINGIFYDDRYIEYIGGEKQFRRTRLGDTSQVLNNYKERFKDETRTWRTDMEWTSTFPSKIKELIRQDAEVTGKIGRSPIKAILAENKALVDSTFHIKENGKPAKTIRFTITAQNVLRYKIDTFAIRQAVCLGDIIRLNNYLNSGTSLDLYRHKDGRWRDPLKTVQVFLVSEGPVARMSLVEEDEEAAPATVPYENGIIFSAGLFWKWNSTKKSWVVTDPKDAKPVTLTPPN